MNTVLVISFSDLSSDPRVSRQLLFLKDHYQLIACGTKKPNLQDVLFFKCDVRKLNFLQKVKALIFLLLKRYKKFYWSYEHVNDIMRQLSTVNADVIIANDLETLPLALRIADKAKIVLDAHEYAPRQFEDRLFWRLFFKPYKDYLCNNYIKEADIVITVSEKIALEYANNYGVKPYVINNAPFFSNISPKKTSPREIRIIHHGSANPSRKIENMIKVLDYLDERYKLDLMLVPSNYESYYKKLCEIVKGNSRVNMISPVSMNDIIKSISQYDIGIYILEPSNFNLEMALPNKIFEFIQARLAVAIGPSTEMKAIVEKFDCGIVARDFSSKAMAEALIGLDNKKIDYYKHQAHKAATMLSAETNKEKFLSLIDSLIGQ